MTPTDSSPAAAPADPAADLAAGWADAARAWSDWWTRALPVAGAPDRATAAIPPVPSIDPAQAASIHERYAARYAELWRAVVASASGAPPSVVEADPADRRFAAPAWRELPWFSFMRQAYLLQSGWLTELARATRLPPEESRRLAFVTKQAIDALAPTNFLATNPEAIARAIETEGASLAHGLANLAADAGRGRISMSEADAFVVGRDLAVTPGSVVFRNELIELIQYAPSTPTVHRRPVVMVPPCINKYYILDLKPSNSLVRHTVAQGHTVFMISWRNIPPELGTLGWDDYLEHGVLAAIRVAREVSGQRDVNALGFCVGGTLLASALAVLAARRERPVASATFLTTMLDFADPGEIGVYVSRGLLAAREPALAAGQRMHGAELAAAFASLRANDLVWNYVVRNYLKGETPPAFDLLAWNGDSANLPGPMYVWYLRELYLGNRLRDPGALAMCGVPADLGDVTVPAYVYASRDDHIVPWKSAWRTTALLGSNDLTFVLGASGHIAGVVNPPDPPRRSHWVNDLLPDDADAWLARADERPGSWWPHWWAWLAERAGPRVRAPVATGSRAHPPLGPAPGNYVVEPAG